MISNSKSAFLKGKYKRYKYYVFKSSSFPRFIIRKMLRKLSFTLDAFVENSNIEGFFILNQLSDLFVLVNNSE